MSDGIVSRDIESEIELLKKALAKVTREKEAIAKENEAIAKEKEAIAKENEQLAKENEAIAKENEQLVRIAKDTDGDSALLRLISKLYSMDIVKKFNIDCYESVLSRSVLDDIAAVIRNFNSLPVTNERSLSINKPESVHYLWKKILQLILSSNSESAGRRVVYEWGIRHVVTNKINAIDFVFIPANACYFDWTNYEGSLELKKNPKSRSNSYSGSKTSYSSNSRKSPSAVNEMINDGLKQSLSRAAMCVKRRWEAAGKTGDHRAFSCYANGRRFAVARVWIDEGCNVIADTTDVMDLPGYGDCLEFKPILILAHLLTAPLRDIKEYMSPPIDTPKVLNGWLKLNESSSPEQWDIGFLLGSGGFSDVYSDRNCNNHSTVVKIIKDEYHYKLANEVGILHLLHTTGGVSSIPKILGVMYSDSSCKVISAIKLSHRGISVKEYLHEVKCDENNKVKKLTIHLSRSIVNVLKEVHKVCVAHCDVRKSNMLIVPRSNVAITVPLGDILTYSIQIANIDLDDCDFILNDWGEAKKFKNDDVDECRVKDLLQLVEAICTLQSEHDTTHIQEPVNKKQKLHHKQSMKPLPLRTISHCIDESKEQLIIYAKKCEYDEIIKTIESVLKSN